MSAGAQYFFCYFLRFNKQSLPLHAYVSRHESFNKLQYCESQYIWREIKQHKYDILLEHIMHISIIKFMELFINFKIIIWRIPMSFYPYITKSLNWNTSKRQKKEDILIFSVDIVLSLLTLSTWSNSHYCF